MSLEHVGRYQITGELGKGAMGVVYRALDPNIGRLVALKTTRLDVHGMGSDEMLRRFRNEARAAGVLNHPNIVTIYDAGEENGLFYIAMEFIMGVTLQTLVSERRTLPVEQVVDIGKQICMGLDYAHARGVVHRDIKPANIMITPDKTVKIMDFGIAHAAGGGGMTNAGEVLGTPSYMSPEQVRGLQLDGRSDLFSAGVMLYEMVTGEKPFAGQNVTTIVYKIVHENPIPPRELDVSIHPGLSAVITRALAKRPEDRYQTGADLSKDLENYKSASTPEEATLVMRSEKAAGPTVKLATSGTAKTKGTQKTKAAPRASGPTGIITGNVAESSATIRRRMRRRRPWPWIAAAALFITLAASASGYVYFYGELSLPPSPAPPAVVQIPAPGETQAQLESSAAIPESAPPSPASTEPSVQPSPEGDVVKRASARLPQPTASATDRPEVPIALPPRHIVSGKGTLEVDSIPEGADILLDGQPTGRQTPATITAYEGAHAITLYKDGYHEASVNLELAPDQVYQYSPTLEPIGGGDLVSGLKRLFGGPPQTKGVLMVRTRPRGARIMLNDTPIPATTPARLPIQPGVYKLTLRRPGYKPVETTVAVQRGKTVFVDQPLDRQ
jgi:serine/threonine protein kinase